MTLRYFDAHNGWDQKADGAIEMNGFGLLNLGDTDLQGTALRGGTLVDTQLRSGTISDSTITNSIITRATIDHSEFTNPTLTSPVLAKPVISDLEVTGGTLDQVSLSDADIADSRLSGIEVSGGTLSGITSDGGIFDKATLTAPTLSDAESSNARLIAPSLEDATLSGSTRIEGELTLPDDLTMSLGALQASQLHADDLTAGKLSVENGLSLKGGRLNGLGDATEPGDAMNLRSTRELIDARLQEASPETQISEIRSDIGELRDTLTSLSGETWVAYRPAPRFDGAIGRLMGDDSLRAIAKIKAMVYNLPDDQGVALGIAPDSIPPELRFLVRKNEDDDASAPYGVDYAQIIGPIVAAIQNLDQRLDALETDAVKR